MKAILENQEIKYIVRWAKNGRKYVWDNPSQEKMDSLIEKYGIDQICDDVLWLEY